MAKRSWPVASSRSRRRPSRRRWQVHSKPASQKLEKGVSSFTEWMIVESGLYRSDSDAAGAENLLTNPLFPGPGHEHFLWATGIENTFVPRHDRASAPPTSTR